jgi:hypothetical protein
VLVEGPAAVPGTLDHDRNGGLGENVSDHESLRVIVVHDKDVSSPGFDGELVSWFSGVR